MGLCGSVGLHITPEKPSLRSVKSLTRCYKVCRLTEADREHPTELKRAEHTVTHEEEDIHVCKASQSNLVSLFMNQL